MLVGLHLDKGTNFALVLVSVLWQEDALWLFTTSGYSRSSKLAEGFP